MGISCSKLSVLRSGCSPLLVMPLRLRDSAPARCEAVTRSGVRCALTAASSMRDASQRLVAEPLRRGGRTCLLHTAHFCTSAAQVSAGAVAVFYLDFETSGLDVLTDEIVEVAVTEESGAQFASTVSPAKLPGDDSVHGICPSELLASPRFGAVFDSLLDFLCSVVERPVADAGSSDDEQDVVFPPSAPESPRTVLLAAHNGSRQNDLARGCATLTRQCACASFCCFVGPFPV